MTCSVDIDSDNNCTAADNDKAHILQAGAQGACDSVNNGNASAIIDGQLSALQMEPGLTPVYNCIAIWAITRCNSAPPLYLYIKYMAASEPKSAQDQPERNWPLTITVCLLTEKLWLTHVRLTPSEYALQHQQFTGCVSCLRFCAALTQPKLQPE